MRILIVTNHFYPEEFRINDIAVALRDKGHEVTVMTGVPDYPGGRFFEGYGIFKRRIEVWNGIRIRRFPLIPRRRGTSVNLILNYLSSMVLSCALAPIYGRKKHDVIFVFETSPIMIGLPAIVTKAITGQPIVFWVLDLWPESLSATGTIHSDWLLNLVGRLVRFIYSRCDQLLVSSPGFAASIDRWAGKNARTSYFPNWVEPGYGREQLDEMSSGLPDLPQGFIVMFAGNIGAAQSFETILAAAEILHSQPDIHWVVAGDGRRFDWVRGEVAARGLTGNFHLLGRLPSRMMPALFSHADVMLVSLRDDPCFSLTLPGKLQSYMASGKPVVAALDGEGGRLVKQSGCGISCPAEDAGALAVAVLKMWRMPLKERCEMGDQGKRFCSLYFNRTSLMDQLEMWLKAAVALKNSDNHNVYHRQKPSG